MDTVTLVDNQVDDGQRLVNALAEAGINVSAAFWAKPPEEDRWSLYTKDDRLHISLAPTLGYNLAAMKWLDEVAGRETTAKVVWRSNEG